MSNLLSVRGLVVDSDDEVGDGHVGHVGVLRGHLDVGAPQVVVVDHHLQGAVVAGLRDQRRDQTLVRLFVLRRGRLAEQVQKVA